MSTLGTSRILTISLYLPESGDWRADIVLEGGDAPALGATTLTVANFTLAGAIVRSGLDAPDRPRVVVTGAPEWQAVVARPISFQSDGGVRLSTVLEAIARAAGRAIEKPADATIGDYYEIVAARMGESVRWCDVLNDLVKAGYVKTWRVDPDGVTRFVARTPTAVTSRATPMTRDQDTGRTTYGADSPAQFLPGNTVEGNAIGRVVVREISNRLEIDAYKTGDAAIPSIRDQIRRMVALAFEDQIRTYVVAAVHADGRLDITPPSDATHLPEMKNVEQWVMGGIKTDPSVGDRVIVTFRDEKKTRPIVVGFQLNSGTFLDIARVTDQVNVFFPAGMPLTGTVSGNPFIGTITLPITGLGVIQTGSQKVRAK